MDDFLSKPIDIGRLRQLASQWLSQSKTMQDVPPDASSTPVQLAATDATDPMSNAESANTARSDQLTEAAQRPILEQEVLTQLAADTSAELPRKLVDMFLGEITQRVEELKALRAAGDLAALGAAAHRMKGSAGTLGAARLHQTVLLLEKAGKSADVDQADQILAALQPTAAETAQALSEWLSSQRG